MEGKGPPQKDIWKHSTSLDVQEPHSPCSCPKIGQIDRGPERMRKLILMQWQLTPFNS